MSHEKKINDDELRIMWADGVHARDIANAFGCKYPSVNRRAEALGLPKRVGTHPFSGAGRETILRAAVVAKKRQDDAPAPLPKAKGPTGYAAIAADASRRGVSLAQATLDFHRARRAGRPAGGRA